VKHAVLGAGGVGGLIAAALAQDGQDVLLVLRPETLEVYPGGLYVESPTLGQLDVEIPAASRLDRQVDVLWITVKATQLEAALRVASPAVARNAVVVPLLNGIDHVARIREVFGEVVVPGAIRVESERVGSGHIVHSSPFAALELAPPPALRTRATAVAAELQSAGLSCYVAESEAQVLWGKLSILAPMALATSSIQQPIGGVRRDQNTCALMLEAMREVRAVATTQGAELDAEALESILLSTPDNFRTSMQKDLSAGRALELDAIAGPIVRVGREHEIPTPATLELVRRVAAAQAL
jgi:2-dehydropantoate 2-reductase